MKSLSVALCGVLLSGCASALPSPGHFGRQPINVGAHSIALPAPRPVALPAPQPSVAPPSRPLDPGEDRQPVNRQGEAIAYRAPQESDTRVVTQQAFTIYYASGETKFLPDASTLRDLRAASSRAQRIEVIGRTDADKSSAADEAVALRRVLAARDYLVQLGADPTHVFIQYASATDYAGDNSTTFGRSQNRRVEIRIN